MQNYSANLVTACQINGGHSSDTLTIEDDIFRTNTVLSTQCMPSSIDIRVKILFAWFSSAHAVARVVVAEDVAVNALAETDEKAGHLAQVNSVSVRKENSKSGK